VSNWRSLRSFAMNSIKGKGCSMGGIKTGVGRFSVPKERTIEDEKTQDQRSVSGAQR
jgi:hypothetical protein